MKIIFDCLGFATANAFIIDDGQQYQFGHIQEDCAGDYKFWYSILYNRHLTKIKVPTREQVINEYKKQFEKLGVCINPNKIVYAG